MRAGGLDRPGQESARRAWAVFALLFALVFLRFCCYGLQYFPQLDDYIQHHNYAAYNDDLWALIRGLGVLGARPASGVLDIVLWSRFWPVMIVGVGLISLLWAGSAVLFQRVWRDYFNTGWLFLVGYALVPLGMEGTYWMSASTRVVPGLFFTALAMWLFQRWCWTGKRWLLPLYFLAQLAAFCFYEQCLVLCITGVALVALLEWGEHRTRAAWALLTFVNVGIYFGFTAAFADSALYSGRTAAVFPWQAGWVERVFLPAAGQMWTAFAKGGVYTAGKGFLRGAALVVREGHWLWLALTLGLCALVFLLARERTRRGGGAPERRLPLALLVGLLMALAPVSIFFILANPWFSLRGTVPSFCGLALMADALVGALLDRLRCRGSVTAALAAALALVFSVAAVSEIHDYKATYENDQAAVSALLAATGNGAGLPAGTTAFLGVEPNYLAEQNFYFHEHIHGVTESEWALAGALQCAAGTKSVPLVRPLPGWTAQWDLEGKDYAAFYGYDRARGTAVHLTPQREEDGSYTLYTDTGAVWGAVTTEGLVRAGEE